MDKHSEIKLNGDEVTAVSNDGGENTTIFIQVRRSQRKSKKKSDPSFIGDEKVQDLRADEEPVIFEVCEVSGEVKGGNDPEKEEELQEEATINTKSDEVPEENLGDEDGDEDVDWEAFNKEYPELSETEHKGKYGCKDCSKSFHHKNDLVRHMNIHNGTKPYTCDTCGKTFLRSDYLRLHVIKHQGIKPLKCDLCERRFYDRSNLRQHMRTHTGEKPAMCPYCPHRCSQLSDMRKHLTIHTKEKAFQCDTCGKTFSLKTGLVAHQRLHTGERPFACEYCPKRFRDHTSMRRHRRIHTGDKPFLCTQCGKTFTQVANMKRHMLTHTAESKGRLYPCPFCGVELASKSDVRSHVAKEHEQKKESQQTKTAESSVVEDGRNGETKNEFITVYPNEDQSSKTNDEGDEAHVCNLCGKTFPLDASLQEHVRTHLNASSKDFQCETCGKTFCQASSLKAHQLVHSGLKPHTCNVCQASFRKTHHLRRHYLVHTGERPYQCDFCDRTFTSSGNLNKHRAIHLGEKNFECEFCSKKFTQSSNLSKHRAIHLRQQAVVEENGQSGDALLGVASSAIVAKRGRAGKKKNVESLVGKPLATTIDELQQEESEGHAAVLHIVGTADETQNDHEAEVSYVTLSDGDIIIEI